MAEGLLFPGCVMDCGCTLDNCYVFENGKALEHVYAVDEEMQAVWQLQYLRPNPQQTSPYGFPIANGLMKTRHNGRPLLKWRLVQRGTLSVRCAVHGLNRG